MPTEAEHAPVTVLFTDVVGSTALRTRLGDDNAQEHLHRHNQIIRELVTENGGRVVKSLGDGFLAAFVSPRRALQCALAIQTAFTSGPSNRSPLRVRVGINSGEVIDDNDDLAGEAVHAAARIMAKANEGEVLVSDVVRQLVGTVPGTAFIDRGRFTLKGFPGRWRLFAVRREEDRASSTDTVFGRDAERRDLRGLLDRVASGKGTGAAVVVEGEAGIGKSCLVDELAGDAASRGFVVRRGAGDELERDRPFRAVAQALPSAFASPSAAELTESSDPAFHLTDLALGELEELATAGAVLVVLEDVHWADDETIRVARSIARRLDQMPVVLVVTCRPWPRSPGIDRLVDDVTDRGDRHLLLEPLDGDAVAALATRLTSAVPSEALLEYLHGAGGNPLYVGQLLAATQADGGIEIVDGRAQVQATALPPTLRLTILRRLSVLPVETLSVLKTASVLGSSFSAIDLATVTGTGTVELITMLDPALHAGVLGEDGKRLAFRHDLIREAIYSELSVPVRQALHRHVAGALIDGGALPFNVAEHVVAGAQEGDELAAQWLREAAVSAAARSARAAPAILERAIGLIGPASPRYASVAADLCDALIRAGRYADAEAVAREALGHDPDNVKLHRNLAMALTNLGRDDAADVRRAALALPALSDHDRSEIEVHVAMHSLLLGQLDEAGAAADAAAGFGRTSGHEYAFAFATAIQSVLATAAGRSDAAVALGVEAMAIAGANTSARVGYIVPFAAGGIALLDVDRYDDAADAFTRGRQRAERTGTEMFLPSFHLLLALRHFVVGSLDDAVTEAQVAVELMGEMEGAAFGATIAYAILARAAMHRGDQAGRDAALAAGRELVERGVGLMGADALMWVAALDHERKGSPDRSVVLLSTAWAATAATPQLITRLLLAADLVRLARDRNPTLAAEVVEQVVEAHERTGSVPSRKALALRCRGLFEDDPALLADAAAAYGHAGRMLEQLTVDEERASVLARSGSRDEAVETLRAAADGYGRMGASADAARVAATLRSLGIRARTSSSRRASPPTFGWDSLTRSEWSVVDLVSEGLTNRQIGERLFISRRTVETHLSHVFTKLGVATRAQVAAEAAVRKTSTESD